LVKCFVKIQNVQYIAQKIKINLLLTSIIGNDIICVYNIKDEIKSKGAWVDITTPLLFLFFAGGSL